MKTSAYYFLLLGATALFLVTCEKKAASNSEPTPQVADKVTLSVSEVTLPSKGTTATTLSLSANTSWSAAGAETWFTISPTNGASGTHTLTITPKEDNPSHEDRNANVKVTAGTSSAMLTVWQKGADALLLTKDTYEVPNNGGDISVEVKSNVTYSVEIPSAYASWISKTGTKALTTKTEVFKIAENPEESSREGMVIFKSGSLADTVHIFQAMKNVLVLSDTLLTVSSKAQTLTVQLRTNVEYEREIPASCDWVSWAETKATRTDQLDIAITANEQETDRTVTLTFKDKNSPLSARLTIIQVEPDALFLTKDTYDVPNEGGDISVEVNSNVTYSVEIPSACASWISKTETKALTTKTEVFKIAENPEESSREGMVIFKSGSLADTVQIFQAMKNVLVLSDTLLTVSSKAQTLTVQLRTNVEYEREIPASCDWVSWAETKATRTDQLDIAITANEQETDRTVTLTFKDKNSQLTARLTIIQAGVDKTAMQREALMAIYRATDGDNWTKNDNWGSDKPLSEWHGVFAQDNKVLHLALMDYPVGSIPPEIGQLPYLTHLILSGRGISGTIPEELYDLSQLRSLSLVETSLEGNLSSKIGNLTNLEELWINISNLSGPIPESIGKLTKLNYLTLIENNFSGPIPETICDLKELKKIKVCYNQLSGTIPAQIGNLTNLTVLMLVDNGLTGLLPESLYQLTSLEELNLINNYFEGGLSEAVGQLTQLKNINLYNNNFTGPIPQAFGNLKQLGSLNLSWNLFNGPIPASLGNLSQATNINLWNNQLTGSIPESLKNLTNVKLLGLGYNRLSGTIPDIFNNMPLLENLYLDKCKLQGEIPPSIGNLKALKTFALYKNQLTGKVPEFIGALPLLKDFDCSGNFLDVSDLSAFSSHPYFAEWDFSKQEKKPTNLYESKDYSSHGQIETLQKATKGKGINIVLMGDAFVDTDMGANGLYDQKMRQAMDAFFGIEPTRSLRDYFNVYAVRLVSRNNTIVKSASTALECELSGRAVLGNLSKCYDYALTVPGIDSQKNLLVIVIVNNKSNYMGGTCSFDMTNQSAVSMNYIPQGDDDTFYSVIQHESVGHGLGFLADEYSSGRGTISPQDKERIQYQQATYDWFPNVDFTNDPEKVAWSYYLKDSRYANQVGIYEGGCEYDKGVYHSSKSSLMNGEGLLNIKSREAVYRRIMLLSGETYSLEKFLEYDAINRAAAQSAPPATKADEAIRRQILELPPPIIQ